MTCDANRVEEYAKNGKQTGGGTAGNLNAFFILTEKTWEIENLGVYK